MLVEEPVGTVPQPGVAGPWAPRPGSLLPVFHLSLSHCGFTTVNPAGVPRGIRGPEILVPCARAGMQGGSEEDRDTGMPENQEAWAGAL